MEKGPAVMEVVKCSRDNNRLNIANANDTDNDRFYLYMRSRRNAIELGRGRDKSHQFTTDRYTEREPLLKPKSQYFCFKAHIVTTNFVILMKMIEMLLILAEIFR